MSSSARLLLLGLALLVGFGLYLAGQVVSPVLIAIIFVATALGIVVSLLEDVDESASDFGQLIISGAMFAEFDSIILLSLFFSREASSTATRLVLLTGFVLLAAGFAFAVLRTTPETALDYIPARRATIGANAPWSRSSATTKYEMW